MARRKNSNRAAAAASSSSSRRPPPAINPSADGPLEHLRVLNLLLVTEAVELRKQNRLLNAKLASKDSVSSDLPHSTAAEGYVAVFPPAELNLEMSASPMDTDAAPTSEMELAATVEISDQPADAAEILSPVKTPPPSMKPCSDLSAGIEGESDSEVIPLHSEENLIAGQAKCDIFSKLEAEEAVAAETSVSLVDSGTLPTSEMESAAATVELLEDVKHILSEHSEFAEQAAENTENIISPAKAAPPSKQLCSNLSVAVSSAPCINDGVEGSDGGAVIPLPEANPATAKTKIERGVFSKLVHLAGILVSFFARILLGCSTSKK